EHLAGIAEINITNARRNPLAQTRNWEFTPESFTADDTANPVIEGMIRRQDCGQVTDGAAAVILASPAFAARWAQQHGCDLADVPRIIGWGHRTAHLQLAAKLQRSA